jgi:hypothetical protein
VILWRQVANLPDEREDWPKLGLSDDQKRQIYSIEAEYKTKIDQVENLPAPGQER